MVLNHFCAVLLIFFIKCVLILKRLETLFQKVRNKKFFYFCKVWDQFKKECLASYSLSSQSSFFKKMRKEVFSTFFTKCVSKNLFFKTIKPFSIFTGVGIINDLDNGFKDSRKFGALSKWTVKRFCDLRRDIKLQYIIKLCISYCALLFLSIPNTMHLCTYNLMSVETCI